jgi:hypothetical protein
MIEYKSFMLERNVIISFDNAMVVLHYEPFKIPQVNTVPL